MKASEARWSSPSLRACPWIISSLTGKHLISPSGTVTLQSFPRNYTLLMLCNLAGQSFGYSDTVIDISWRCFCSYGSDEKAVPNYGPIRGFISEAECAAADSTQTQLHTHCVCDYIKACNGCKVIHHFHCVLYSRYIIYKCLFSICYLTAEEHSQCDWCPQDFSEISAQTTGAFSSLFLVFQGDKDINFVVLHFDYTVDEKLVVLRCTDRWHSKEWTYSNMLFFLLHLFMDIDKDRETHRDKQNELSFYVWIQ